MKNKLILLVLGAVLFVVLLGAGLFWWKGPHFLDKKMLTNCTSFSARVLAQKENLKPLQSCTVDGFKLDNEGFSLIEIVYGEGEDCPSGCIYKYKTFLLKGLGQVIKSFDSFYQTPDLSLGFSDQACSYVFSGHLGAMLRTDPEHITRTLIREGGEYKWKFQLENFSGHEPGFEGYGPKYEAYYESMYGYKPGRKCVRTGVITTNLDGKDVKVLGIPQFRIE